MPPEIDPICAAFVGGAGGSDDTPSDALDLDGGPDAFQKFVSTAELAGALGGRAGWSHVENFESETADIDKRFSKLSPPPVKRAMAKSGDDLDAPLIDDDPQRLEKSGDRRKRSLALWMRGELALGKSAKELIDYAAVHDLETANLMREIASELGAI